MLKHHNCKKKKNQTLALKILNETPAITSLLPSLYPGTKQQVNAALEMIRKHFPVTQYPDITLVQVSSHQQQTHAASQVQPTLNAQSMQVCVLWINFI